MALSLVGPLEALKASIRGVLIEDDDIKTHPIAGDRLQADDVLPGCTIKLDSAHVEKVLGPEDASRRYLTRIEWTCSDRDEVDGRAEADALNERTKQLLTEVIDTTAGGAQEMPDARLNRYLSGLGYEGDYPLESGEITPYPVYLGKDQDAPRWVIGYLYDFRLVATG